MNLLLGMFEPSPEAKQWATEMDQDRFKGFFYTTDNFKNTTDKIRISTAFTCFRHHETEPVRVGIVHKKNQLLISGDIGKLRGPFEAKSVDFRDGFGRIIIKGNRNRAIDKGEFDLYTLQYRKQAYRPDPLSYMMTFHSN